MNGHASKQNPPDASRKCSNLHKVHTHAKKNASDKKVTEHVRWMLNSASAYLRRPKGLLHAGVAASERERM